VNNTDYPQGSLPRTHNTVKRVKVVGNSGSGKTTFARQLAGRLGVPHRELDEVFWGENWTMRETGHVHQLLTNWFRHEAANGWVIDGNWNNRLGDFLENAPGGGPDAIVWLDYPRSVIMWRLIRRTLGRVISRKAIWNGNKERISNLFSRDLQLNILRWAWTEHYAYRQQYEKLSAADSRFIRLETPRETKRWLNSLGTAAN